MVAGLRICKRATRCPYGAHWFSSPIVSWAQILVMISTVAFSTLNDALLQLVTPRHLMWGWGHRTAVANAHFLLQIAFCQIPVTQKGARVFHAISSASIAQLRLPERSYPILLPRIPRSTLHAEHFPHCGDRTCTSYASAGQSAAKFVCNIPDATSKYTPCGTIYNIHVAVYTQRIYRGKLRRPSLLPLIWD